VNGRRKKHHSHEVDDPYAEGWDARLAWRGGDKPENPYAGTTSPKSNDWQLGWDDCHTDKTRGDLEDVTVHDFRRLPDEVRQRRDWFHRSIMVSPTKRE
jgi:hypothetical protein